MCAQLSWLGVSITRVRDVSSNPDGLILVTNVNITITNKRKQQIHLKGAPNLTTYYEKIGLQNKLVTNKSMNQTATTTSFPPSL